MGTVILTADAAISPELEHTILALGGIGLLMACLFASRIFISMYRDAETPRLRTIGAVFFVALMLLAILDIVYLYYVGVSFKNT